MLRERVAKTYAEFLWDIIELWRTRHPGEPFETREIAAFAIDQRLWQPELRSIV